MRNDLDWKRIKPTIFYLMVFLTIGCLMGCKPLVQHDDPFYNYNDSDFPRDHLPLINPVEATRERLSAPWGMKLLTGLHVDLPRSEEQGVVEVYIYYRIEELDKFAVKDGVIVAYSPYVDDQAAPFIRDDFYHWFVMVPDDNITKGFHSTARCQLVGWVRS